MDKLTDHIKCVPFKAFRNKWNKIPRRDLHIHAATRIQFSLRAEMRTTMLMLASRTKIGCGGMQRKGTAFLKLSCRLYDGEHHLSAAWWNTELNHRKVRQSQRKAAFHSFSGALLAKSIHLHLPYIYFEFGVILRHIFLDQAVRSFLRLTKAGESQWQDVFQLDLLLWSRSGSAFLKYTYFYASVGPKTLGFSDPATNRWEVLLTVATDLKNQVL